MKFLTSERRRSKWDRRRKFIGHKQSRKTSVPTAGPFSQLQSNRRSQEQNELLWHVERGIGYPFIFNDDRELGNNSNRLSPAMSWDCSSWQRAAEAVDERGDSRYSGLPRLVFYFFQKLNFAFSGHGPPISREERGEEGEGSYRKRKRQPQRTLEDRNIVLDMLSASRRVLVFGGCGALGKSIISSFKAATPCWTASSVDFSSSSEADDNLILAAGAPAQQQTEKLIEMTNEVEFNAIISVAGSWTGGSLSTSSIVGDCEKMLSVNTLSALTASHIASKRLAPNGLLVLTGARPCLRTTPDMLAYGISKNAVHHIVKSLSLTPCDDLPQGAQVACILPVTLDTAANRRAMPNADFSSWTPLEHVSQQLLQWASDGDVKHGGFYSVDTEQGLTTFNLVP